jgi:hypothetical protein
MAYFRGQLTQNHMGSAWSPKALCCSFGTPWPKPSPKFGWFPSQLKTPVPLGHWIASWIGPSRGASEYPLWVSCVNRWCDLVETIPRTWMNTRAEIRWLWRCRWVQGSAAPQIDNQTTMMTFPLDPFWGSGASATDCQSMADSDP